MGWSYNSWLNNFYPEGLKKSQFLAEYSKHFKTVEADSSFYRVPSENTVASWKEQTPDYFLFSLKFPKAVTHDKMLKDSESHVEFFLKRISLLKRKVGALLLQFPYAFGDETHLDLLRDFLGFIPKDYRFCVEIRNKNLIQDKLHSLLRDHNVALAMLDHPFWPKTEVLTADFAYIRWEGDRRKVNGTLGRAEVDKTAKIQEWAQKIKLFDDQIEVFGYFSKYYSGHPPTDAKQLLDALSARYE